MPKSPQEMFEAIARNLPERTGKSIDEWVEIAKDAPEGKKSEKIEWLSEQGLGRGQARTVLYYSEGPEIDYDDQEGLINDMFKGRHEDLLPVFGNVRDMVASIGDDVEVSARKTYVSFNRNRQFLIVLPKKGELVLGFALPDDLEDDRLMPANNIGGSDRIKWYVGIQDPEDLPKYMDLIGSAYEAN
jgi:predicted transport protein